MEAARIPIFWEDFSGSKRRPRDHLPLKCQGIKTKESLTSCHHQGEPEETKHSSGVPDRKQGLLGGVPGRKQGHRKHAFLLVRKKKYRNQQNALVTHGS